MVTPERLEELVRAADANAVVQALGGLEEKQRRKLSKTAGALLSRAKKADQRRGTPGGLTPEEKREFNSLAAAQVAVLGTGALTAAKRVEWGYESDSAAMMKVLDDRRPEWVGAWLERVFDREHSRPRWTGVRGLVASGVCEKPKHPRYLELFGSDLVPWGQQRGEGPGIVDRLLADPELLEHEVWLLFQQGHDFFSQETGRYAEADEYWPHALTRLAAEGQVDRDRLIRASLGAFWTTSAKPELSGFAHFLRVLAPTGSELEGHAQAVLDLLGHAEGRVVGEALKLASKMQAAGAIELERLAPALALPTRLPQKSHARSALQLLRRILSVSPTLASSSVEALANALSHPDADVQAAALSIWEEHREVLGGEAIGALSGSLGSISPTLHERAAALSGEAPVGVDVAEDDDLDEWEARAEALSPAVRRRLGLESWEAGLPGRLELGPLSLRALDDVEPLIPIASLDELFDEIGRVLEVVDSLDQVERLLDALARFADAPLDGHAARVEPHLKRLSDAESGWQLHVTGGALRVSLLALMGCWLLGGKELRFEDKEHQPEGVARFHCERFSEFLAAIRERRSFRPLATPSHSLGWIEPSVLVERVAATSRDRLSERPADLVLALLRLAPEGRGAALARAAALEGVAGRVLRFALGGEARKEPKDLGALWLAALRARAPLAAAADVMGTGSWNGPDWPDGGAPAWFSWSSSDAIDPAFREPRRVVLELEQGSVLVEDSPEPVRQTLVGHFDIGQKLKQVWRSLEAVAGGGEGRRLEKRSQLSLSPTVLRHHRRETGFREAAWGTLPWRVELLVSLWPTQVDAVLARGVRAIVQRQDQDASTWEPAHVFLQPLFEPARPWTELAYLLLGVSLLSKDADVSGLATDALIEGIADGRADASVLGAVLAKLQEGKWPKPGRLADALGEVARPSELHRLFVARTIEGWLAGPAGLPPRAQSALELLLSSLTELELPLSRGVAARWPEPKGSSKTAKLIRGLLALSSSPDSPSARRARAQALQARVQLAARLVDPDEP